MSPDLVLVAGPLAVLGQGLQGLGDESHVVLVDVEPQQPQPARGAATHDVQELQRLTHQVVVGFVVLAPQEVLWSRAQEWDPDPSLPTPLQLQSGGDLGWGWPWNLSPTASPAMNSSHKLSTRDGALHMGKLRHKAAGAKPGQIPALPPAQPQS